MNCVILIVMFDDEILLQKRDNKTDIKYPGYWAIPGGGIEYGETPVDALCREFREEIVIPKNMKVSFQFLDVIKNEWGYYEYIFYTRIENKNGVYCKEGQRSFFFKFGQYSDKMPTLPMHHKKALEILRWHYIKNQLKDKEDCFMERNVRDYVTISRLGTEKKPKEYEETGHGYIIKKGESLTALYHNGEPMECLAYIEFDPSKTRGDHYHLEKIENMCVVKGTIRAKYMLPDKPDDILELELKAGDIVHILPGCAHSYLSNEFAVALEFSPQRFKVSDTIDIDFTW